VTFSSVHYRRTTKHKSNEVMNLGLDYMRLNNHRIRENGKKRSLFDKVHEINQHIKTILPEIEHDKLIAVMAHCRRHHEGNLHYGRRGSANPKPRELTYTERLIYDYLLRNNLNPSTTYRWFLASRIPSDIQALLKKRQVSVKRAFYLAANRLRNRLSKEGLLMMEEIRHIIRKY
jgi:cysteinyl-tRNA synthetase